MGVLKKLKDVLFDIEEEEIPEITKENKYIKKEENPIKEVKMPKEEIDNEIIKPKSEPKFTFPLDFDDEIPERSKRDYFEDDFASSRSYRETKIKKEEPVKKKDDYSRFNLNDTKKETKPFKLSPIISPVYGILDQNYTKDDVIVKSDVNTTKNPSLDDVRKKAYGKNNEEVSGEIDEFEEPLKTLDEILIDRDEQISENNTEVQPITEEPLLEEEPLVYDDELPDEPFADEKTNEDIEEKEDTIESDLFNLIDSMYEERNEREEPND
jgi:hypothetical protein